MSGWDDLKWFICVCFGVDRYWEWLDNYLKNKIFFKFRMWIYSECKGCCYVDLGDF